MKLFLSLLLLCGSAIGQTKAAACIEGDTQGIVITTSPPQYEWNKCVNGKWVRVEPAHNPTASFNPVDVSRLEARIAALEKRVRNLEDSKIDNSNFHCHNNRATKLEDCNKSAEEIKK